MAEPVEEFGELFAEFVRRSLDAEPKKEPAFRVLIRDHLDTDPMEIPIVALDVADWDHANLQFGLEALIGKPGRKTELVGIGGGDADEAEQKPDQARQAEPLAVARRSRDHC